MKSLLALGLVITVAWIDPDMANPSRRRHEEFNISILEKGTEYQQEVDLDEDDDIVTVHVPAHNDIDETYFITDIEKHLTMRVATQQKMCFLTENDPEELPPADVWRKTRDTLQDQVINDTQSIIKRMSYRISESLSISERQDLADKMQKMCDGLPIVRIEPMFENLLEAGQESEIMPKMTFYTNYTKMEERETKRFKRVPFHFSRWFPPIIDYCNPRDTAQMCVVFENACYRVRQCITEYNKDGTQGARCERQHIYNDVRCCKPCCLTEVPEDNPCPPCNKQFTKEEVCPNHSFA